MPGETPCRAAAPPRRDRVRPKPRAQLAAQLRGPRAALAPDRSRCAARSYFPSSVWAGITYPASWSPSGPKTYAGKILEDAGAVNAISLAASEAYDKNNLALAAQYGGVADFWLGAPRDYGTLGAAVTDLPSLASFRAVTCHNVWNSGKRYNAATYATDFLEGAVLHPDEVLRDMVTIFYGGNTPTKYYAEAAPSGHAYSCPSRASPSPSPSPSPGPAITTASTRCVGDRSVLLPQVILAEGYACASLVPYGVRCENEYQAIAATCPASRDKADWIFSLYYKFTGSCATTPSASRLYTNTSAPPSGMIGACLDRRATPDTCISDRSASLGTTIISQAYACQRMATYGVNCDAAFVRLALDCPTPRDLSDWVYSTHYALTGTCNVQSTGSLLVTRSALAVDYPAVRPQCVERRL